VPQRPLKPPSGASSPAREYPPFPREEPGQKTRFWLEVFGWTLRWAWLSFKRVPKTVRVLLYIWVAIALLAQWNSRGEHRKDSSAAQDTSAAQDISAADAQKLKAISDAYQGGASKPDAENLALQITREFANVADQAVSAHTEILAIPFSAPAGNAAAAKLADATFAQVYGRIAISHHGHVGLTSAVPATLDAAKAVEQGRAHHAHYVLYGSVDPSAAEKLSVSIVGVPDGDVEWSKSYPLAGAEPAAVAAEVASELSKLEDD